MNKVAALPIEELVGSLAKTATGSTRWSTRKASKGRRNTLGATMDQVQQIVGRIDAAATPLLGSVSAAAQSANATLREAQAAIASIERTVGANSALTGDAESLMQELSRAARSIRVFADYLDRHPDALLRGKRGGT